MSISSSPARPLTIAGLGKSFGGKPVLAGIDMAVGAGECLALLGPSGSGKSTLLSIIAGFKRGDAGRIDLGGQDLAALPPHRRGIGMVFQHYALFPHLDVAGNIAYPLARRGMAGEAARERVARLLALVKLEPYATAPIQTLSGGQQQRVAIARALAAEPGLLLMDEPMGALDRALREELQVELKLLLQQIGATVVYVTHDQQEAMALADSIAILHEGRLAQIGPAETLHAAPTSAFVARFLWAGASSLHGHAISAPDAHGQIAVDIGGHHLAALWRGQSIAAGAPVEIVLRPDRLTLQPTGQAQTLPARVLTSLFAGQHRLLQLEAADGTRLQLHQPLSQAAALPGSIVSVGWEAHAALAFPAGASA